MTPAKRTGAVHERQRRVVGQARRAVDLHGTVDHVVQHVLQIRERANVRALRVRDQATAEPRAS